MMPLDHHGYPSIPGEIYTAGGWTGTDRDAGYLSTSLFQAMEEEAEVEIGKILHLPSCTI